MEKRELPIGHILTLLDEIHKILDEEWVRENTSSVKNQGDTHMAYSNGRCDGIAFAKKKVTKLRRLFVAAVKS